jgi:RNA-binding protein YhbY
MKSDNQPACGNLSFDPGDAVAMNGLEKFSHLEDKIYRTIELTKALRQEKEDLERELVTLRTRSGDREELITEIDRLLHEREAIRIKVQNLLDRVMAIDPEIAEGIGA